MDEAGYHGAHLSMLAWTILMRFVPGNGLTVSELAAQALVEQKQIKFMLGCLERWGYVALGAQTATEQPAGGRQPGAARENNGWGSGRGVGAGWMVWLTGKGAQARAIWPPLFNAIEQRWRSRFGDARFDRLRECLLAIESGLNVGLPHGLIEVRERKQAFPVRVSAGAQALPLPTLLSQILLAFAIEFEPASEAPLALCANALRALGEKPIPVSEISRLTGGSPEQAGIGWRLRPYVVVETDLAGGRGKTVRLTARGMNAQRAYERLIDVIEKRWVHRYGSSLVQTLRESLLGLFDAGTNGRPLIALGLIAPPRHGARRRNCACTGPPVGWLRGAAAGTRHRCSKRSVRRRSGRRASALSSVGHEPRFRPVARRNCLTDRAIQKQQRPPMFPRTPCRSPPSG